VVILPVEVARGGFDTVLLYAEEREVTVTLAAPLGARVLVHASGCPVPVDVSAVTVA
jgi:hypothetical protein